MGIWNRLFGRRRRYDDLAVSMQEHLDEKIDELVDSGMDRREAEQAARRAFGNVTLMAERSRETWHWPFLESILADARYAFRQVRRNPGFAPVVVGTLTVGIGAAAAMFTVVDRVLVRPVPYQDAGRLVALEETNGTSDFTWPSPRADIQTWQAQSRSFSGIALSTTLTGRNYLVKGTSAAAVDARKVSANLFTVLGVQPAMGRGLVAEPLSAPGEGDAGAVVLSDRVWKEVFGGDASIVGKAVRINDQSYTVTGVMPAGFRYPAGWGMAPQVWVPIEPGKDDAGRDFKAMQYAVVARLRPGATVASATAELKLVQKRVMANYTDAQLRKDHKVVRVRPYADTLVDGNVHKALLSLLAAAGVLWLIATVNAANLMLARSTVRQREIAMRGALGASRRRVMQQMMVEGLLLSVVAGALGIGLAIGSVKLLSHELYQTLPVPTPARPDGWILLALTGMTALSAVLSTGWPALASARAPIEPALRQGSAQAGGARRHHRLRSGLVVAQIAMSLALLAICGLLLRTIYSLQHVPLGYRTDHIVVANLSIPSYRFGGRNMTEALYQPLLERVQHMEGVQSAGLTSEVPLGKTFVLHLEMQLNGSTIVSWMKAVSPETQKVFGLRMMAGRFFGPQDVAGSQPVLVVNKAFAKLYSPDKHNPAAIIGSHLLDLRKNAPMQIIGILDDEHQQAIGAPAYPEVDIAIPQITPKSGFYKPIEGIAMDLAVRTDQPVKEIMPELRAVLRQTSPELQNANITTMDQIVEDSYGSQRLAAHLLEIFGGSALLLCVAGIYGLLAYVVRQRAHELGVRIALGAERRHLLWLVMRQAGAMLLAGVALGSGLAFASGRLIRGFLYGVKAHDMWTLACTAVFMVACGLAAAYLPARRAASVDPMEALRAE